MTAPFFDQFMKNLRMTDIVVLAALLGLAGFMVACQTHRNEGFRDQSACINNLRTLRGRYDNYINENGAPMTAVSTNLGGSREYVGQQEKTYMHFRAIFSSHFNSTAPNHPIDEVVCPLDNRRPAPLGSMENTNISYFISVNPPREQGRWILMGNRNLSLSNAIRSDGTSRTTFSWNPKSGLHGRTGYLMFADSSMALADNVALAGFFDQAGNRTNSVEIP